MPATNISFNNVLESEKYALVLTEGGFVDSSVKNEVKIVLYRL